MTHSLPVHCCCDPNTILGRVEVDERYVRPGRIRFLVAPTLEELVRRPLTFDPADRAFLRVLGIGADEAPPASTAAQIETEIQWLQVGTYRFLAVKSGHVPLDIWQRVRAFRKG